MGMCKRGKMPRPLKLKSSEEMAKRDMVVGSSLF